MLQVKVVKKIKTLVLCSVIPPRKSCRLWDNVEKYGRVGQATDDNIILPMRIAHWITTATDTLRICDIYCFCTATLVTRINETAMPASANEGSWCAAVVLSLMPENYEVSGGIGPELRAGRLRFGIRHVLLLCHRLCTGSEILWSRV